MSVRESTKNMNAFQGRQGQACRSKLYISSGGGAKNEGPGPPLSKGFGHVLHKCVSKPTKMVMRHQGGSEKKFNLEVLPPSSKCTCV